MSLKQNLKSRATKLVKDIPVVYMALKHKQTPLFAKILAAFTVVYALSPVDLIPEFIPIIGYLDDLILLPILIVWTVKLIPKDVWSECESLAENMWKDGKPVKWYYAIPFVVFWLLILAVILKIIFSK